MKLSKLSRCIISPSRLATTLEWNKKTGTIMGLEVTKSRVAVAIAKHPSYYNPIRKLDAIPYQAHHEHLTFQFQYSGKEAVLKELTKIATLEGICGIIVGWPLEPSGFPGSRCGQVLHLLDYLAEKRHEGKYLINGNSRPIAFWDERNFTHQQFEEQKDPLDEWGRCQIFGKKTTASSKDVKGDANNLTYTTSLRSDHPSSDDSTVACMILEQFLYHHSHILISDQDNELRSEQSAGNDCNNIIDQTVEEGNYMESLLL